MTAAAHKPLRITLFTIDLIRILFLAASLPLLAVMQAAVGGVYPYLAYLSSNALFPLISFFILIKPLDYRNYLPLYMSGKVIAVVLFYAWDVLSLPGEAAFAGMDYIKQSYLLSIGTYCICLFDTISVFGSWILNKKLPRDKVPELGANGGL